MDINLLKRLVRMVENSKITEFSVEEGDLKVKISKISENNQQLVIPQQYSNPIQNANSPLPVQESATIPKKEETKSQDEKKYHEICSPIVGTFYRAPAPDADQYVQVGDSISSGTVLCIVEAMKLMNEIESDVSGKIVKILVENATPVEYNQPLFLVDVN